jgi:hypothetical protein
MERRNRFHVMKKLFSLLACACVFALTACDATSVTLTQENLDKVQEGMTAAQVKAILGSPTGSKDEPIPVVGGTKTTYTYASTDGDKVVIVLKNDTVQSKEGSFPAKK